MDGPGDAQPQIHPAAGTSHTAPSTSPTLAGRRNHPMDQVRAAGSDGGRSRLRGQPRRDHPTETVSSSPMKVQREIPGTLMGPIVETENNNVYRTTLRSGSSRKASPKSSRRPWWMCNQIHSGAVNFPGPGSSSMRQRDTPVWQYAGAISLRYLPPRGKGGAGLHGCEELEKRLRPRTTI